jgi:hypothetical protein
LVVLAVLLLLDGAGGGLSVATAVSRVSGETAGFVAALGLRLIVSGLAVAAASLLIRLRPQAAAMASFALVGSAVATTIEYGCGFASSTLFPLAKWPVVIAAWLYAAAWLSGLAALRRREQRDGDNEV